MKNIIEYILESRTKVVVDNEQEFIDDVIEHADGMLGDNSDNHYCDCNKIKNNNEDELNKFVKTVMERTCNKNNYDYEILNDDDMTNLLKNKIKKLIKEEY